MKTNNRKAQVTVFIIIGLVLLVSASIVIYITQIRKIEVIEEVVVPPEVQPVYDFVTSCLYQIGTDGLVIMGTQGGYTDLSRERIGTRDITMTPSAYIKVDPANIFKLPLWFYEGEERIPTLEFMQAELADYVNRNLASCLNNFSSFKPSFEITELAMPQLSSIITEDDVAVILDYPVEIRQGEKMTEHDRFIARIPVRLKKMHELAAAIARTADETLILENLTIDLMSMSEDVPMDPHGIEFDCGGKMWRLDDVEKQVQRIIYYNMPSMRVKGTDYPPFTASDNVYETLRQFTMEDINEGRLPDIETPIDAFEYNRMMIDPAIAGAEDMRVSFVYLPRWGMDLNALPNEAGILRSNVAPGQGFLSFICLNIYHFTYDVIYPVQVRINDPAAYMDQGYLFQFGFPVLIEDNQPNREEFGTRVFEGYYIDTGFCEDLGGSPAEIKVTGIDEAGYHMTSGLRGVNITYLCINRKCNLGQTGYNQDAPGRYSLVTALPAGCSNPMIEAEKEGYLNARGQMTGDYLELDMIKVRKMPFTLAKHTYSGSQEMLLEGTEKGLSTGDTVSIYMRLVNKPGIVHDQYKMYEFGQNETDYIELVEGESQYDIDIMLHNYNTHMGGYKTKNLTIKYSDFSTKDEMVFHVFEYSPRPITDEKQLDMATYYMEGEYAEQLKPTFR